MAHIKNYMKEYIRRYIFKSTSDISEITGYVDSVKGVNNPTNLNPPDPSLPYQSLDALYTDLRNIYGESLFITIVVQNGNVEMALNKYFSLTVSNPNNNSRLTINQKVDSTIYLIAVTFSINVNIVLATYCAICPPVISTSLFFVVENDTLLNVIESLPDFTKGYNPVIIFNHDGVIESDRKLFNGINSDLLIGSLVYIRQGPSDIVMSRPGQIHYGGLDLDIDTPTTQKSFSTTNYYYEGPDSLGLKLISRAIRTIDYYTPNKDNVKSNCLGQIKNILENPTPCVTYSDLVIIRMDYSISSDEKISDHYDELSSEDKYLYSLPNCPEYNYNLKEKCNKFINHNNDLIRNLANKILTSGDRSQIFNSNINVRTIRGVNSNNSALAEKQIFLTNIPGIDISNVNLSGDIKPFPDDIIENSSDFNMQLDSNSYYNSGSIFRRPNIITQDYTHTQFDGVVFLVNASQNDITITIPIGDISDNRIFEYKRVDRSDHIVKITSVNKIEGHRNIYLDRVSCKSNNNSYIRLYGYNDNIYIFKS